MKTFKVYLAGPITGLSYGGCTSWRDAAAETLKRRSNSRIECYSPMRAKQHLKSEDVIWDTYEEDILSSQRGIFARDKWDVVTSDALLVNLLGAETVSIGTIFEMAWAQDHNIPIFLAMEPAGSIPSNVTQVEESAESYEFRGDNGDYAPNDTERLLMVDFAHGLLSDLKVNLNNRGDNIHEHCFVREACPIRVPTLDAAMDACLKWLLPDGWVQPEPTVKFQYLMGPAPGGGKVIDWAAKHREAARAIRASADPCPNVRRAG